MSEANRAQPTSSDSEFITSKEAALELKVSEQTLANWRSTKRYDLAFYRVGARGVRYKRGEVRQFAQRVVGSSDAPPQ